MPLLLVPHDDQIVTTIVLISAGFFALGIIAALTISVRQWWERRR